MATSIKHQKNIRSPGPRDLVTPRDPSFWSLADHVSSRDLRLDLWFNPSTKAGFAVASKTCWIYWEHACAVLDIFLQDTPIISCNPTEFIELSVKMRLQQNATLDLEWCRTFKTRFQAINIAVVLENSDKILGGDCLSTNWTQRRLSSTTWVLLGALGFNMFQLWPESKAADHQGQTWWAPVYEVLRECAMTELSSWTCGIYGILWNYIIRFQMFTWLCAMSWDFCDVSICARPS